jgi:hypothetical protein
MMKKFEKLSDNEVQEIYALLNGKLVDLVEVNWNYNLMQDILTGVGENDPLGIRSRSIFRKLFMITDIEILRILINCDVYWGVDNENSYKSLGKISPKEKIIEILAPQSPSETPLKWNIGEITELEFLMVSQTMRHDFVVFVGETFEENYSMWSVNRKNFRKLMGELALSNQTIKVRKLEVAKANIF